MNKFKKIFNLTTFAFISFVVLGFVNVKATDYKLEEQYEKIMGGNELTLTTEDSLSYGNEVWFGPDGRFTINDGEVSFNYNQGMIYITLDKASVTLITGKQFITQVEMGSQKYPVTLTIDNDSELNVFGTLVIPSGTNSVLVNNGTIMLIGNMELRDRADNYEGTGELHVYGNLAIYGTSGSNIGNNKFYLYSLANVYSDFDVYDNIIQGSESGEGFIYTLEELEDKTFQSVTKDLANSVDGLVTFTYGYTIKSEHDTTFSESVNTTKLTTTEKNETNPNTSDNVIGYGILSLISFVGIGAISLRLRKNN